MAHRKHIVWEVYLYKSLKSLTALTQKLGATHPTVQALIRFSQEW